MYENTLGIWKMESEAIEKLAIDSAAGELNEDADALLRTYLAEHPQAKQWAEDVRQIYDKTEAAINAKTTGDYASGRTRFVEPNRLRQINWPRLARWAAVVMFAILMGFSVGRLDQSDKTYRIALSAPVRAPGRIETVSELKEKYAGTFWGDKALALLEHKPSRQYKAGLRGVGLLGRYKQHIKEKRYE